MLRFPISANVPPSVRHAKVVEIKSRERLLSEPKWRLLSCERNAATANAAQSRELLRSSTKIERKCLCLCGAPAVPRTGAPSHCAYSTALRPTPPAAACTMKFRPRWRCDRSRDMWVVLQVTGSVHACSKVNGSGLGASDMSSVRARDARGACARPNAGRPSDWPELMVPDESPPGGPGSPGYSPSTLRTSRKLRPTARTASRTSLLLEHSISSCDSM
eukprot:4970734-Prymnesium_polylepis.4